jgi:hypothetical protein
MSETLDLPSWCSRLKAPQTVLTALQDLVRQLQAQVDGNLYSVVVFGSLAAGNFVSEASDINLMVVLNEASGQQIRSLVPAFRGIWQQFQVRPMIMTAQEIGKAADVFPIKFLTIMENHCVIFGEDPFAGLQISHAHLRLRLEQELRNAALRMRQRLLSISEDKTALLAALAGVVSPLNVQLRMLLRLSGKRWADLSFAAVLKAFAQEFSLNTEVLASLAELRRDDAHEPPSVDELFDATLSLITQAANRCDSLESTNERI